MKLLLFTAIFIVLAINVGAVNRLTFYHNNNGMVSELLEIPLDRGLNSFTYNNIPLTIDANTVMLIPRNEDAFAIDTQSYVTEVDTWYTFINKHLNEEVDLVMTDGSLITGKLFYNDRTMVGIEEQDKRSFVRFGEVRNIKLAKEERKFIAEPTLNWRLRTDKKAEYTGILNYLCTNLNWNGIYKAIWNEDELQLEIMAAITNNTGRDFQDFHVSLLAGEPQRIRPPGIPYQRELAAARGMVDSIQMEADAPQVEVEEFDEYHRFSYSEKINLANKETKQISLYPTKHVTPRVYYEYRTGTKGVETKLEIKNDEQSGLGVVLPQGTIQIYRVNEGQVADQQITFVGEDRVEQLPSDEKWTITPGRAFDLVGETTVLDTRRPARNITERDMKIEVKNRSDTLKDLQVKHRLSGDWTIRDNNYPYERIDAQHIVFKQNLKAGEELIITWTERIERR